jgi:hypothetical protein
MKTIYSLIYLQCKRYILVDAFEESAARIHLCLRLYFLKSSSLPKTLKKRNDQSDQSRLMQMKLERHSFSTFEEPAQCSVVDAKVVGKELWGELYTGSRLEKSEQTLDLHIKKETTFDLIHLMNPLHCCP